ncbi:MAG: FecR domain-containing protein [Betaproteobacteria bacterium]|nr:FecR domain-containing protein [Betaproteobacteria bacterium]
MFPHDQFRLTRQAALLAAISAAFPTAGYAAVAGRIDFSVGEVSATAPDGKVRPLARGAEVAVGDTIVTGATGRAQVRFTDGAYSSVQPQTQFRVDDYQYAGKTDGSEKSFFSLLKGGLRTITGAIGRVNKQAYRVTTPTATIGIRGTEYLAREGNSLTVSVGEGIIEVCNAAGCLTVADGHSAFVRDPNTLPTFTLIKPKESPPPPTGPGGGGVPQPNPDPKPTGSEQTDCNPATQTCDATSGVEETPSIVTAPPPPPTTAVLSGRAAAISAGLGSTTGNVSFADCVGAACGAPDHTVSFSDANVTRIEVSSDPTLFDGLIAGTVEGQSVDDVLFLGRWINGTVHAFGFSDTSDLTAGPGQGYHYVVGVPTSPMPASGVGTYSLAAATVPTFSDGLGGGLGTGSVTAGTLTADFGAGTLGASMDLSFSGSSGSSNYQMSSSGTPISGSGFTGFGETAFQGGAVNVCSDGCITLYNGFFAGTDASHAGLAYEVFTDGGFDINGAAAFRQTGLETLQPIAGVGSFSFGGNLPDFGNQVVADLEFDDGTGFKNASNQFVRFENINGIFDLGTATVVENGFEQTGTATIAWGRWTNGTFTVAGEEGLVNVSVSSNQGFHYFGGVPTLASEMASLASGAMTGTYSLLGSTQATSADGSLGLGTFTGALVADFGASKVGLDFNVAFSSASYQVATTGGTADPGLSELNIVAADSHFFNLIPIPTTGSGAACASGCSTFVEGLFAGTNAARAGFTYLIDDDSLTNTVHGAAAFTQDSLVAPPPPDQLIAGSGAFSLGGNLPDFGNNLTIDLDFSEGTATINSLGQATRFVNLDSEFNLGTASVVDFGFEQSATATIAWGRWTNGTFTADGGEGPFNVSVSSNQGFHYFGGVATTSLQMASLASLAQKATYTLISGGATSATASDGSLGLGTFGGGSLVADFGAGKVGLAFNVTFPSVSYSVATTGGTSDPALSELDIVTSPNAHFHNLSFGIPTSASGPACSSGCATYVEGLFAGTNAARAGFTYLIEDFINFDQSVHGAAAFQQASLGAALVSGSGFMMAASPDGGEGIVSSVNATFDSSSRLTAYLGTTVFATSTQGSLGTTTIPAADSGADSVIGWGRWTNGTTATTLGFDPLGHPMTLSANQGFHYVVGTPTPGADLIALAVSSTSATYSLMGATSATSSDGSLGLGTFSGNLEAFFSSGFVSVNMGLNFPSASGGAQTYSLSGSASGLFASGVPNFAGSVFGSASNSGAAGFCVSGCSGSINGFFAGANAARAGLSYTVFTDSPIINGAAAFKQSSVCPGCDNF